MIPISDFMNVLNKLIFTLKQYSIGLQPHTHVFWVITATKLHSQCSAKMGISLIENGEVGVDIHL